MICVETLARLFADDPNAYDPDLEPKGLFAAPLKAAEGEWMPSRLEKGVQFYPDTVVEQWSR